MREGLREQGLFFSSLKKKGLKGWEMRENDR